MSKTIGWLIKRLEEAKSETLVEFAPFRLVPTQVASWRGIYAEAALEYSYGITKTVGSLLSNLKDSIDGREFHGYKGGDYSYNENTPLHVDNYGDSIGGGEIFDVEVTDRIVRIHVKPYDK